MSFEDEDNFGLGDSAPLSMPPPIQNAAQAGKVSRQLVTQDLVAQYRQIATTVLSSANSKKEALNLQSQSLNECVVIASEIYKNFPTPDHAYQLAALASSHNSTISQHEKLRDPNAELAEIEKMLKVMFENVFKSLAGEIDKSKKELTRIYPQDKATIDDLFVRMLQAVTPDTKKYYEEMNTNLKKTLGLKK
jgi:hypothetical protein